MLDHTSNESLSQTEKQMHSQQFEDALGDSIQNFNFWQIFLVFFNPEACEPNAPSEHTHQT